MSRREAQPDLNRTSGIGMVVFGAFITLAVDVAAVAFSLMAGGANYSQNQAYPHTSQAALLVLITYLLLASGLGIRWYARRQMAKIIGLALGLLPIVWLVLQLFIEV